jgi:hypothetical protein
MVAPAISSAIIHESTVRSLSQSGQEVRIELEDVSLDGNETEENRVSVFVTIKNVEQITLSSSFIDYIFYEMEYGEVITSDKKIGGIVFIVKLINYTLNLSNIAVYNFVGGVILYKVA